MHLSGCVICSRVAPPGGGDNVPSLLRHEPRRGYNKIQLQLHILTSLGLCVHKTLCFKLFPAESDGIRSGYYHSRNALKPTNSHLRSQNFPGEKPPLRNARIPLKPPYKCRCTIVGLQFQSRYNSHTVHCYVIWFAADNWKPCNVLFPVPPGIQKLGWVKTFKTVTLPLYPLYHSLV